MTKAGSLSSNLRNVKSLALALICSLVLLNASVASGKPYLGKKGRLCRALRSMARVYLAYGDYAKAQPLAEKALTLARTQNAPVPELCSCLIDLAYVYDKQGRLSEAEKMCKLGLKLQEKVYCKDHPHIAYTLRILSSIYQGQSRYRDAQSALERAMAIMQSWHIPDDQHDRIMAPFQVDIAKLLVEQGNFPDAEAYYQEALALIENSYGPNHLYTAGVLGGIARLYTLQGRYLEAESLINRTLVIQEKVYGSDHHLLTPAWMTMAKINQAKKDYTGAEKLLQKALDVVEKKQGAEHPLTGRILTFLGDLYIANERYTEAEGICQQAVKVMESSLGPDNDRTAMAFNNLARLCIHQEKYLEAQDLCLRALNTLENIFDESHPNVKEVLATMAQLHQKAGNVLEVAKSQQMEDISTPTQVTPESITKATE